MLVTAGEALPLTIRQLLEEQDRGKRDFALEERWMLKYSQVIDIDFLGVWDTVGRLVCPLGTFHS